MPYLKIDLPGGDVHLHDIAKEQTTIGRSTSNDLAVPDLAVSRHHAVISRSGDRYLIEDLGSRHGTFLNNQHLRGPLPLRDGDKIRLGSWHATFTEGAATPGSRVPDPSEELAWNGETLVRLGMEALSETSREVLIRDLQIARLVQRFLLPAESPRVEGYRFFGDTQPCFEVGGDFYDCFVRADGRVGLVVADVAGKGIGAALLGHFTQALIRTAIEYDRRLGHAVEWVNRQVNQHSGPNQYVTVFVGVVDPVTGAMEYVNAGHCPGVLLGADGTIEELGGENVALGVLPDFEFAAGERRLAPGGALFLYTDGVTECRDHEDRFFGEERLRSLLAGRQASSPDQLARDLEGALEGFAPGARPHDDITFLIAQRLVGGPGA